MRLAQSELCLELVLIGALCGLYLSEIVLENVRVDLVGSSAREIDTAWISNRRGVRTGEIIVMERSVANVTWSK